MRDRISLRSRPGEIEIAVWVGGGLADHALWRPGRPDGFGDLHVGRAGRRVASLGGCFVRLEGEPDGFLPDRETGAPPGEGAPLAVRIVRSSHGGKGPRLTCALSAAERAQASSGEVRLVRRGPSPLDELARAHAGLAVETSDRGLAADLHAEFGERLSVVPAVAEDDALASLRETEIGLPGGARASIWPTPALVAVDVDSASGSDGVAAKQVAQFAANRLLLPRLLHELRLRNLSGAIVVDLAGLALRKRRLLAGDFSSALAADPLRPRFLGFSALGLAEIVRARRRPALHELAAGPYARALAAASALASRQAEDPHAAYALRVPPDVGRILAEDACIGRDLARASGRALIVHNDASLAPDGWRIEECEA